MIHVICKDQKITYSAYHLVKAFWPDREADLAVDGSQQERILVQGEELPEPVSAEDIRELYQNLRRIKKEDLPWGMLTGVRPVKLASGWIQEQDREDPDAEEAFLRWFGREKFVTPQKARLAFRIARKERALLKQFQPGEASGDISGYSLYLGIPFCPSICSYCSFSSGSIRQYRDRVDAYLHAMVREMEEKTAEYGKEQGSWQQPSTIYIGGGTPTSLSPEQLGWLLEQTEALFHVREGLTNGAIREYTVEAGRPDSITEEKLQILKQYHTTRISINPQTMQQKTLDRIGRNHTVRQVADTFHMAREMGFDNINMDLIAGLPGESAEDVQDTLMQIRALDPDSLTVHALAMKRSSRMGISRRLGQDGAPEISQAAEIGRMIEDARQTAEEMGMNPYYLYRQKSIAGNFENTGYAKPGKEGLYNIVIMEEVQSILACGAGASQKLVLKEPVPNPARKGQMTYMIRTENVKNIDEYIRHYGSH